MNSYLDCGFSCTTLTVNDTGIGVYDRNNANGVTQSYGATNGGSERFALYAPYSDNVVYSDEYDSASDLASPSISGAIGFLFATRRSSSEHAIYRNGSQVAISSAGAGSLPNFNPFFFARNFTGGPTEFTQHSLAFLPITAGMNSTQAAVFNTRVQALQTALGRNV